MKYLTHPIEPEEVMAYLDGELEPARAAEVAAHLDICAECQSVAAALKSVSREMLAWEVEASPVSLSQRVSESARMPDENVNKKQSLKQSPIAALERLSERWFANRWVLAGAGALATLSIIFYFTPVFYHLRTIPGLSQHPVSVDSARAVFPIDRATGGGISGEVAGAGTGSDRGITTAGRLREEGAQAGNNLLADKFGAIAHGPMIARTASLTIVAKDFSGTRAAVEKIVNAHQGYLADLTLTNQKDSPQTLTGTLQIPADQLNAAIAELRALGHVEQESQSGEEISATYVDLLARLHNSRESEKRLTEILQQRTGKLSDVLATEQEIARVRGEIEEMESQQKQMEHRVQFTSIKLQVTEEFKAALGVPSSISFTRLRNALADGFHNAAESFFNFLEFLLNIGPALLLWAALLIWPTRLAWRRLQRHRAKNATASAA